MRDKDVWLTSVGVALRAASWMTDSLENSRHSYLPFVSHHSHTNEAIMECSLAISNGWPTSLDTCNPRLSTYAIHALHQLLSALPRGLVTAASIALQLGVFTLLSNLTTSEKKYDLYLLYWLNPYIIGMSRVSLIGSLFHVAITCLMTLVTRRKHVPMGPFLALLISWDFKFISLVPIFCTSALGMSIFSSMACSAAMGAASYMHGSAHSLQLSVLKFQSHAYYPSVGVIWYLQGQVFSPFKIYFERLLSLQPFLYSLPLTIRFRDEPDIGVRQHSYSSAVFRN